jgi:hypothetical protein
MSHVLSTGRRCAALAFNEPCPLTGDDQAIPQVACLSIPLAGSTPMLPRVLHSSWLARYRGCSRDISILYALWTLWHSGDRPDVTSVSCSFHFAPGPTCRGSVSLYVPPLSYKREGTRRYKAGSLRLSDSQVHTSSQAYKLNTTHSGVGYYTPVAWTNLNPCVLLCSSFI